MYGTEYVQNFIDKTEKLVAKIVHRSEDLINLRGFVLDSASDFEVRIKNLLKIAWQKLNDPEKAIIDSKMKKQINSICARDNKKATRAFEASCIFTSVYNDKNFYTNNDWLAVLDHILKIFRKNDCFSYLDFPNNFNQEYTNKIAKYRNALGHRVAKDKFIQIKSNDVAIDERLHKQMRANIHHMEQLVRILEKFVTENLNK